MTLITPHLTIAKMDVQSGVAQMDKSGYRGAEISPTATRRSSQADGRIVDAHEDCDTIPLLWHMPTGSLL